MITLNELAYNIKNIAYGGQTTDENTITTKQIKFWIHYHRARLIAENVDRGILDRPEIYQYVQLGAYNCSSSYIRQYIRNYKLYLIGDLAQPAQTGYIEHWPKTSEGLLLNYFLAHSSLVFGPSSQAWANAGTNDQFGQDLYSDNQDRGNFRNTGMQTFVVPTPLLFENTKGLARVSMNRRVYTNDIVSTTDENEQAYGWATRSETVQFKSTDEQMHNKHNKFTNFHNEPYYHFANLTINNDTQSSSSIGGSNEETILAIKNIKVSPNYHGNLNDAGEETLYYMYNAGYNGIFEDPTNVGGPRYSSYNSQAFNLYNNHAGPNISKHAKEPKGWKDDKTNYPIPMDMVGDLIQRIVQMEIQPSLKTMPEVVSDSFDDTTKMKISGSQVQK